MSGKHTGPIRPLTFDTTDPHGYTEIFTRVIIIGSASLSLAMAFAVGFLVGVKVGQ